MAPYRLTYAESESTRSLMGSVPTEVRHDPDEISWMPGRM